MAKKFTLKNCAECGSTFGPEGYIESKSPFFPDGHLPICNNCIEKMVIKTEKNWNIADKLCQWADFPFIINEWISLFETNREKTFLVYSRMFKSNYTGVDWSELNQHYLELQKEDTLRYEIPGMSEEKIKELKLKWGMQYCTEDLYYLEQLYNGLMNTQNVNGDLQLDQAKKLCKVSLIIDERIRAGDDFDKMLGSYEKLTKVAEFNPKNVKNAVDFDSVGEVCAFLEKRGWQNKFYDGAIKDEVDNTMKNIQAYNRKLYTNESGMAEEIDRKIAALKSMDELERNYHDDLDNNDDDLDKYDSEGYDFLKEDFKEEI